MKIAMQIDDNPLPPRTMQELKTQIATRKIVFPTSLERVARYVIDNPETAVFTTASATAVRCNVSKTTVVRLARHLGFQSFTEFKKFLQNYVRNNGAEQ